MAADTASALTARLKAWLLSGVRPEAGSELVGAPTPPSPAEERFEAESAGAKAPPPMVRWTWRW